LIDSIQVETDCDFTLEDFKDDNIEITNRYDHSSKKQNILTEKEQELVTRVILNECYFPVFSG
jgi:hypothetical protein